MTKEMLHNSIRFSWGIGQEIIDHDKIVELMKQSSHFRKMKKEQKEKLIMRIKQLYNKCKKRRINSLYKFNNFR